MSGHVCVRAARRFWAVLAVVLSASLLTPGQAAASSHNNLSLTLEPKTTTVTAGDKVCVTAKLKRANANVSGETVYFTVSGANTATGSAVTNNGGTAEFCYLPTKAGTDTISAYADVNKNGTRDSSDPAAQATVTVRAGPATAATLTPTTATNTVGEEHCVTFTATDRFGNPVSGANVVFRVTGVNPTGPVTRTTGTNGTATFCYTGTNAGTDTITAFVDRDNDKVRDPDETVVATATKVYLAKAASKVVLTPATATNVVGDRHCVTATVTDAKGKPVAAGVPVVFSVTGANPTGSSVTVKTDASGQATFCYTGTKAGTDTITGFADNNANGALDVGEPVGVATKIYVPGQPATLTASPVTAENTVGTQHCVTVTATDALNNSVPNVSVVFTVSGANPTGPSTKTTDAAGQATFCYTGTKVGVDMITAYADSNKNQNMDAGEPVATATKVYQPGIPNSVTLAPETGTNRAGEEHCVTATVVDEFGNRVGAGHPVVFAVTGANPTGPVTVKTNADGQAKFCYTGTKVGADAITAYADNNANGTQDVGEPFGAASKNYTPGPAAEVILSPDTATNRAGEEHCVTATVTDRFGNAVNAGTTVYFSVSGANPTALPTPVVTGAAGTAEFCYTGTNKGTDTITAYIDNNTNTQQDDGEPADTATKTYRAAAPAAVEVTPLTATNVVGEEHCVTATVTDRFGNTVDAGVAVFFSVTGANPSAGPSTVKTDGSGQATFCYTGTKVGMDTIRSVADGNEDGNQDAGEPTAVATKTYLPGPPANVDLNPAAAINVAGEEHCVTATVTDGFGNPVAAGHEIIFSVSGANSSAAPVITFTDSDGEAEFCYTGTKKGIDTITAYADNNHNATRDADEPADTATKTYRAGPPANIAVTPAAATNVVGEEHCVTATVTDRFENTVEAGVEVQFVVTGAVVTTGTTTTLGTSGSDTTDANGQATFCYTSQLPGENVITAFVDQNNNGTADPGEPLGAATKTYVLPASSPLCDVQISDGGLILAANADRGTFGGNAKTDANGLVVSGSQEYTDHGPLTPLHVKSIEVLAVVCQANSATIYGIARVDSRSPVYPTGTYPFRVRVTDSGEPSTADTYGILIGNGYYTGEQPLLGGNIQIHHER